jgi:hypothetical protein
MQLSIQHHYVYIMCCFLKLCSAQVGHSAATQFRDATLYYRRLKYLRHYRVSLTEDTAKNASMLPCSTAFFFTFQPQALLHHRTKGGRGINAARSTPKSDLIIAASEARGMRWQVGRSRVRDPRK